MRIQPSYYVVAAIVIGLVLGALGWVLFSPRSAQAPATNSMATSTTGNGVSVVAQGQATIGEVTVPVPSTPALAFSADLSDDAKQALKTQYNTLVPELKASPNRVDLWLELGVVYKIAGQYDAAIAAWTFVAKAGPSTINYIAYGNLGDLYLNFVHDYPKAAASYQAALKIQPNNVDYQAGLKAAQAAQ